MLQEENSCWCVGKGGRGVIEPVYSTGYGQLSYPLQALIPWLTVRSTEAGLGRVVMGSALLRRDALEKHSFAVV